MLGGWYRFGTCLGQAFRKIIRAGDHNTIFANDLFQSSRGNDGFVCSIHPHISKCVEIRKFMWGRKGDLCGLSRLNAWQWLFLGLKESIESSSRINEGVNADLYGRGSVGGGTDVSNRRR